MRKRYIIIFYLFLFFQKSWFRSFWKIILNMAHETGFDGIVLKMIGYSTHTHTHTHRDTPSHTHTHPHTQTHRARLHQPHKTFQFHQPNFTPLVSIVQRSRTHRGRSSLGVVGTFHITYISCHILFMEFHNRIGRAQGLSFCSGRFHKMDGFIVILRLAHQLLTRREELREVQEMRFPQEAKLQPSERISVTSNKSKVLDHF